MNLTFFLRGGLVSLVVFWSYLQLSPVHAAILLESNGQSIGQNSTSYASIAAEQSASSGFALRHQRKVGIGFAGSGVWGTLGTHLELNFSSEYSLQGGVGLGEGYQTFALQVRRYLSGQSFLPYIALGMGRWYTTGSGRGEIKTSTPEFLAERFLNDDERRRGQFSELLLVPSAGIQYLQLSGSWMGSSIFAEINLLVDLDDLILGPIGSLGYTYYF